jgi:hypothetical protein
VTGQGTIPRMGGPRILTSDEAREAFAADWAAEIPRTRMAATHGLKTAAAVSKAAKRLGLPPRRPGPRGRTIESPEQEEAFRRDWAMGMPLKEMAALHGYASGQGVSQAARRLELPARSTGGRSRLAPPPGDWRYCPFRRVQVYVERVS